MGLIKKVDVDKYLAERRATRLGRTGPLSQTGARIERTGKVKISAAAAFIEAVEPVPVACDLDIDNVSRSRQM
jgi:hypothetical protein